MQGVLGGRKGFGVAAASPEPSTRVRKRRREHNFYFPGAAQQLDIGHESKARASFVHPSSSEQAAKVNVSPEP